MAFLLDVGGTLWPDGPREAGVLGIESRYLGQAAFLLPELPAWKPLAFRRLKRRS